METGSALFLILDGYHGAQLLNYLKATDCEVGIILNFGPKAKVVRKVLDNELKRPTPNA